ncbi:MAG: hypothetical protein GX414_11250 [Acidobacteria bacterium]|nr:hypothetical protein [Acidobacteriota bacterium]
MSKVRVMMITWVAILALAIPAMAADFMHRPLELKPALTRGTGIWLFKGAPAAGLQNAVEKSTAPQAGYRWRPATLKAGAPSILVYTDDPYNPAPNTLLDQALQWWGLPYTAIYNGAFAAFETTLASQAWDIVIFANDNNGPPPSTFTALENYLLSGGILYVHTWRAGNAPSLITNMGANIWSNLGSPMPIYQWDPSHPIFTDPKSVPDFLTFATVYYGIYGQMLMCQPGFDALAGYTPSPDSYSAALILGNDGRSILRGFMDAPLAIDQDGDFMLDGVELWINTLAYLTGGGYDLIFVDDYGRSKLCINSDTGDYVYHVLTGTGAGEYAGTGVFKAYNYGYYFYNQDGNPWLVYVNHATNINRATGYLKWGAKRINSVLYDRITTDNPDSCD